MRWCYEIEHTDRGYHVLAWIDGRVGSGYAVARRRPKAMKLAMRKCLTSNPVSASEVLEHMKAFDPWQVRYPSKSRLVSKSHR